MKILIAIPTYDGKLPVEVVRCILEEQTVATAAGDELQTRFLPGCSHPAMGRNQLVQEFLDSDADRMVFVDADITWRIGDLLKLAHKPVDLVGGAYRLKMEPEGYPVGWNKKPELWANEHGLLEVELLPTGFLAMNRAVFERFSEKHGDRSFAHMGHMLYAYFQMPYHRDLGMCGEDFFFCIEYRQAGGQVWLDPELELTHWDGNIKYPGHIGRWLKNRPLQLAA